MGCDVFLFRVSRPGNIGGKPVEEFLSNRLSHCAPYGVDLFECDDDVVRDFSDLVVRVETYAEDFDFDLLRKDAEIPDGWEMCSVGSRADGSEHFGFAEHLRADENPDRKDVIVDAWDVSHRYSTIRPVVLFAMGVDELFCWRKPDAVRALVRTWHGVENTAWYRMDAEHARQVVACAGEDVSVIEDGADYAYHEWW